MDIFDQIKKKKSDKKVKTKKTKTSKQTKVEETVEKVKETVVETVAEPIVETKVESPIPQSDTPKISNPWTNETKPDTLNAEADHHSGESEEWDNDEEIEDVPEFAAMKIGEIKKKEMKRVQTKEGYKMVEVDEEAKVLGWGNDNPLIGKEDGDGDESEEKEEIKETVVAPTAKPKAFVPRARRPGHTAGATTMRTGPGMGGLKRQRKQQTYKVDDVNSFPTLGTTMNDVKPEGFHSVQTNSYGNRPGHHSNKGLDVSNRFGNLA